jgi:CBS domain-containing protein
MLLSEFCTTDVACCARDTTIIEAARLMRRKHIGALVIVDDPDEDAQPVGLVTDRDIVIKVLGNELDPAKTRVADIMSKPVVMASESEDSSIATSRMRDHGIRRLPVTDSHGKLVGIVTLDDLLTGLRRTVNSLIEVVAKEQDKEKRLSR